MAKSIIHTDALVESCTKRRELPITCQRKFKKSVFVTFSKELSFSYLMCSKKLWLFQWSSKSIKSIQILLNHTGIAIDKGGKCFLDFFRGTNCFEVFWWCTITLTNSLYSITRKYSVYLHKPLTNKYINEMMRKFIYL